MTRRILTTIFVALITLCTHAQTISPNESAEFCPLTDITFTVTLPRIADNTTPNVSSWTNTPIVVSGVSNLTNTQTQTTFTFVGRFRDVNIKQVFKIDYTPIGGSASAYYPEFKYIKSLTTFGNGTQNDCSAIKPTPTSINAPRCQNGSVGISFSNIQYSNVYENPVVCYGTVTNYEYLLPNGWSLTTGSTTTVSNGSTWIAGSNSVTVTYDLATGNGGNVRIRPVNTQCGSGLAKGREVVIPVSRPLPSLFITLGQTYLCRDRKSVV